MSGSGCALNTAAGVDAVGGVMHFIEARERVLKAGERGIVGILGPAATALGFGSSKCPAAGAAGSSASGSATL